MKITLDKLTLNDFQGRSFVLGPKGKDVSVYARNRIGKTILASAYTWLTSGKDSLGRSTFAIKNLDADGRAEHRLNHSVEGVFKVETERSTWDITLKKLHREKWVTKRGKSGDKFDGHTNDHFIDGVGCSEKLFTDKIREMFGSEENVMLVTSPTYFPLLPWRKQRELIMDVGGIKDIDIIESDAQFEPLLLIMDRYASSADPIEFHRKALKARQTEIAPYLGEGKKEGIITIQIKEVKHGMPDITGLSLSTLSQVIAMTEVAVNEKKLELQGVDIGGQIAEISKKLNIARSDLSMMEIDWSGARMKALRKIDDEIKNIERDTRKAQTRIDDINNEITLNDKNIDTTENVLLKLRGDWTVVNKTGVKGEVVDTCAACGQSLPADEVQAAKDKALAEFNRTKAEMLTDIDRRGKAIAEEKEQYRMKIESLQKELAELEAESTVDIEGLKAERDELEKTANDYTFLPLHSSLSEQIKELEAELQAGKEGRAVDTDKIKEEIDIKVAELKDLKSKNDLFTLREGGATRIEELKAQEKDLATEYEKLESELYLTELFMKTKVDQLTDKINVLFELVHFKLFEIQVNGGISECCELTMNGVPYGAGLNNEGRINGGLDVCRTLARHLKLQAPVFVDNAEAVCNLINMDTQVVRLVVSEGRWLPEGHPEIPVMGNFNKRHVGEKGREYTEVFIPDDKLRVVNN